MAKALFRLLVLVAVAWASPARAWNQSGHMQIALMAYDALSPEARKGVSALLRQHPRFHPDFVARTPRSLSGAEVDRHRFALAATWPDLARRTPRYHHGRWHYVNLRLWLEATPPRGPALGECPEARRRLDVVRKSQASAAGDPRDVEEALAKAFQTLENPAEPASSRALWLSWVLHLVADAHQPLHAVALFTERRFPEGDRGGNEILVRGRGNLHRVWDGLLGSATRPPGLERALGELRAEPDHDRVFARAGRRLSVASWIDESCELARRAVYVPGLLSEVVRRVGRGRRGDARRPSVELSSTQIEAARAHARGRALQAAARLAAVLERLF